MIIFTLSLEMASLDKPSVKRLYNSAPKMTLGPLKHNQPGAQKAKEVC